MKIVLIAGLFARALFIHGCAAHHTFPSADHIVGLSSSELRACAGAPTDEENMGDHALWTYVRKVRGIPGSFYAPSDLVHRCEAEVAIDQGRVQKVLFRTDQEYGLCATIFSVCSKSR